MIRRAAKRDDNHAEIVRAFRDLLCIVEDMASVGNGFPDLLVQIGGKVVFVEIKDGRKPPSAQKLTPAQKAFRMRWPVQIVTSPEDVMRLVTATRRAAA